MRHLITLAGTVALVVTIALPAFAGNGDEKFLDTFATQSYSGNDGTHNFSGPWTEINEGNGPTTGDVSVSNHPYCDGAWCLKIGGTGSGITGRGVKRAVDLAEATWAQLEFEYGRELPDDDSSGTAVVQISPDGGDSWSTLKTIALDADDGRMKFRTTIVISKFASRDTVIRFEITEAENLDAYWLIDNVSVESTHSSPTTTTTAPPKTTTTTTTTAPPETTTTTRPLVTKTTFIPRTTTPTAPLLSFDKNVPPEDHDTMMNKSGLTITAAMPPIAVPTSTAEGSSRARPHAEPVEALAAAFFTEAGNFGGSLIPSIALGIVISVASLIGIGSRKEE